MNQIIEFSKLVHFTFGDSVLEIIYLLASILFIIGLKRLSHPDTAKRGNLWAATGMLIAIVATLLLHRQNEHRIGNFGFIFTAIAIGTITGWIIARKVKMTKMPEMVSLFNGMGGAAAALISLMEFPHINKELIMQHGLLNWQALVIFLGLIIGSVSFAGSIIAFGKLDGRIKDIRSRLLRLVNIILLVVIIGITLFIMTRGQINPVELTPFVYILLAISLVYGVLFVMPIGGADMPVVISLLNSFTGVAAAMGGFLYNNLVMLTGGILVGSAGTILTILMCKAMNRSLFNVIIGAFGGNETSVESEIGTIKEVSITDAAILLSYSRKVMVVPGYGLAVAQAQHLAHELDIVLEEKGLEVKYAIHPVAGRMPGHMNVLLAEADVPYEKLIESEQANDEMENVDVVVVIGANDVVNPAALDDPGSPIYGMPIINTLKAKNVIVMKRGMGKGYAAIENNLFFHEKTRMLFGNAKETLQKLVSEIKNM
ncbi:MAG: NAD(P) transhydrogenase subunit beta [Bacteroidetes bacterium GWC2_33_15]|nr:MAG: NAD(P) transhydrogenase subunit beta [Bacteroidetes bacterium GWA2_33_15]OFX51060.1 MAG: NAD(P) transhydrogenase subunit beta [Bacteroidetes bacterium GWC2_33_15]OFX66507.1 MAG: NAD(P) transhydrogenase subunit beta [Bacteroidetes bacterium GWB2_32_14]OFX70268.1 MAG: NAD(P) transhydrogenase subunit beta [Bacteroidetes bacterium GWD2_33_33]HAN17265.1 NAD(P) transhydrogenase subunit beta [Bacteroidales bacterium]